MRTGFSDVEMEALRIVEKYCSRWSRARRDALQEEIAQAMSDHANDVAMEQAQHSG